MKSPSPTMREVAARARVSVSTVSLALRNSPRVGAATRSAVAAAAAALGYRIHPLVAAHMRTRRRPAHRAMRPVLAIVNTQRLRDGWRDNRTTMVRAMLTGARAQAAARGYETREFWLHEPGMSHARFSDMLRARGVHGILLGPSSDLPLELDLKWEWFSAVRMGSARMTPLLHRVVVDHYQVGRLAALQAHAAGYRRPLLPMREPFSAAHDRRMEGGFHTAWTYLPGTRAAPVPATQGMADAAQLAQWLRDYRPDIVIENEERNLLDLLVRAGWNVPEDIGYLSMCSPEPGGAISGCVQDGALVAAAAVDLLTAMVERNETGLPAAPVTLSANAVWNPGRTMRNRGEDRKAGTGNRGRETGVG
ncbi:MAG: LacI family DNA-binding transcriptional regulator [Opitutaceae bacterium]|nr:LacI family DNA-binding transcriptional regulator [Opitutaceae bacterium]